VPGTRPNIFPHSTRGGEEHKPAAADPARTDGYGEARTSRGAGGCGARGARRLVYDRREVVLLMAGGA